LQEAFWQGTKRREMLQLTPREKQVARLVADGLQNKAIAGQLGLSLLTIKVYTRAIYRKLGIAERPGNSRAMLVKFMS